MAPPEGGRAHLNLSVSDPPDRPGRVVPWAGRLLALGTRAARYSRTSTGRQLVIALSVPKRDLAACLVGCGWVLASEAPTLAAPLDALREMKPGEPLRAVNCSQVITGFFTSLDERATPPRAQFAGSFWLVDRIRALAPLSELDQPRRAPRPEPGSLEHMARLDVNWESHLALPAADLAIVGTVAWLEKDFETHLAKEEDDLPLSQIGSLLMPRDSGSATWFTDVHASATLADKLPLADDVNAVVLDGNGAIKYLTEIEAPVVICVLDRSVGDETAAEMVVQLRNTRGEPISLADDLGWCPPAGVEAMAFTVAI